jgi:hypothetical protein
LRREKDANVRTGKMYKTLAQMEKIDKFLA